MTRTIGLFRAISEGFSVTLLISLLPACVGLTVWLVLTGATRWLFLCTYAVWTGFDRFRGGRGRTWWCFKMRPLRLLNGVRRAARAYFPAELVFEDREAVARIAGPVIYGCHPHGIFGIGTLLNFGIASRIGGMQAALPTSPPVHILTLAVSFWVPFWRDLLVRCGLGPADRATCRACLEEAKHSIALVVGGAREALLARRGEYHLILRRRRGIFRIALETGRPLVPVFTFGEVDLYDQLQLPGPLRFLQSALIRVLGFSVPLASGRFGMLLPHRRQLRTVVGLPIDPCALDGVLNGKEMSGERMLSGREIHPPSGKAIHPPSSREIHTPSDDELIERLQEVYIAQIRDMFGRHCRDGSVLVIS